MCLKAVSGKSHMVETDSEAFSDETKLDLCLH